MGRFNDLVWRFLLHNCIFALFLTSVSASNTVITIVLNKTLSLNNKELYADYVSLPENNTIEFNLVIDKQINKNISFIIFQVHSHLHNVTLYNNTNTSGSRVTGTNLGLYSSANPLKDKFFVINPSGVELKLLISIHGYGATDPIPGGCNMEFPIPVSPFMTVSYNKDYILVDSALAKSYNDGCNGKGPVITFYRMYLPEQNFNEEIYFEGIRSMMVLENILENGDLLPASGLWGARRMLAAYAGTGAVYAAVARTAGSYAVYPPAASYACDPTGDDGCVLLDDVLSQLLCAGLCFVGAFICFCGHRFFKTEMFLVGLASGALVTYIALGILADLDRPALIGASLLSGAFSGAAWLAFWWLYGLPALSVLLTTLNVGFLAAAILYYRLPGGEPILEQDFNFWTLFIFVMLLVSMLVMSTTHWSNILCCCVLGSYCILFPIDYYVGSSLKYIVINTLRRAVVPKFNYAIVAPPFFLNDALLTVLWVGLALAGLLLQRHRARGRPPFPPPPRGVRQSVNTHSPTTVRVIQPIVYTEASPLLA